MFSTSAFVLLRESEFERLEIMTTNQEAEELTMDTDDEVLDATHGSGEESSSASPSAADTDDDDDSQYDLYYTGRSFTDIGEEEVGRRQKESTLESMCLCVRVRGTF